MLKVLLNDVNISIEKKLVLSSITAEFSQNKKILISGPNGSGKSTLLKGIFKSPFVNVTSGSITIHNDKKTLPLKKLSLKDLLKLGLFLVFQNPPELEGINLLDFLYQSYTNIYKNDNNNKTKQISKTEFKKRVCTKLAFVNLSKDFLERDLNFGFSGGEKKKIEMLQILLLKPKLIFLDEIDSGLDIASQKSIANILNNLTLKNNVGLVVISHNKSFQNMFSFDKTIELS